MNPQTILNRYECETPPPLLWRVNEKISQTQRDAEHRPTAPNRLLPITKQEFKEAVQNHLDWANRSKASCFLSVFSDKADACNWALGRFESLRQRYKINEDNVKLVRLEINSARLIQHTWIFDAQEITTLLDLEVKTYPGEYLVYRDIPNRAIVSKSGLAELKMETANESAMKHADKSLVALFDEVEIAEDAGNVADDEDPGEDEDGEDVDDSEDEEWRTNLTGLGERCFLRP